MIFFIFLSLVAGEKYTNDFSCSLCRILTTEIHYQASLVDPLKTIEKGSFRLGNNGELTTNKIQYSRSDTFLTTVLDLLCKDMGVYGQKWANNTPFFVRFESYNGDQFNTTGVHKDENITLWLKDKCDDFIDDYEDQVKSVFMTTDPGESFLKRVQESLCIDELELCSDYHLQIDDQLEYVDIENIDTLEESEDSTDEDLEQEFENEEWRKYQLAQNNSNHDNEGNFGEKEDFGEENPDNVDSSSLRMMKRFHK